MKRNVESHFSSNESNTMIRRAMPSTKKLRWQQSWVMRLSAIASLILMCGYATSIIISAQGIDTISKIAYRADIEASMMDHMQTLKELHQLRRDLLKANLEGYLREAIPLPQSEAELISLLKMPKLAASFNVSEASYVRDESIDQPTSASVEWVSQEVLRVGSWIVTMPPSEAFTIFNNIENLRQEYHIIGQRLYDEIQPALIKANSIVLLATFLILISVFLLVLRRFRNKLATLLDGMAKWSESDANFRFHEPWKGELALIAEGFNTMADEVEENRQRNLYLEKVASWQTIARKLAHEIKNPLTPIQMMVAQLTRRYKGDDKEFSTLLENAQTIVSEEIASLRRMVDHFSKFARLPVPQFESKDMVKLINHVVELEQPALENVDIKVSLNCQKPAVSLIDEGLIRQVLINLIKNAAEASDKPLALIEIVLREKGRFYYISVKDNGPGIPEDLQAKIFEAYFTTKHTGPTPGMGLGLAVCQKIVLDHGGQLTLYSKPGNTVFTIQIPKKHKVH